MKWEYLIETQHSDEIESQKKMLAERGLEGWELVSIVEPRECCMFFYFKRQAPITFHMERVAR